MLKTREAATRRDESRDMVASVLMVLWRCKTEKAEEWSSYTFPACEVSEMHVL